MKVHCEGADVREEYKLKFYTGEEEVSEEDYQSYIAYLIRMACIEDIIDEKKELEVIQFYNQAKVDDPVIDETNSDPYLFKNKLLAETRALELIQSYHREKLKTPLIDAARNEPELFQSKTFRSFIADVLEGKQKSPKGSSHKRTKDKIRKIRAYVDYYKNMGIPVYYDGNGINAARLVSDKMAGVSEGAIKKALEKKRDAGGQTTLFGSGRLTSSDGVLIFILNGFQVPDSESCIAILEERINILSDEKYKMLCKFGQGYDAQKVKGNFPKNQQELNDVIAKLESRENYNEIKKMQIREISLN